MSWLMLSILVVIFFSRSSSLDIERFQTLPIPTKGLDMEQYRGIWYIQGRNGPCSWSGSFTFTDFVFNFQPKGSYYLMKSYWRQNGIPVCTDALTVITVNGPGIFQQQDSIGNVYSGEWFLLETDYKKYSVSYACTKRSVDGHKCSDPYVTVETRHPHPDHFTLAKIDRVLKTRFDLSISDLISVSHKNPCVKKTPSSYWDYSYLSKKY